MHVAARRPRPTLAEFANRRIGNGTQADQLANLLLRPFAAPSFIAFWRKWNPVYGYYLYYWSYRPLRRFVPRPVAELLTFAASGFLLHDIPLFAVRRAAGFPYVTAWFVLAGAIAIAAEAWRMDLSRWPAAARVAVNAGYLLSTLCAVVAFTIVV